MKKYFLSLFLFVGVVTSVNALVPIIVVLDNTSSSQVSLNYYGSFFWQNFSGGGNGANYYNGEFGSAIPAASSRTYNFASYTSGGYTIPPNDLYKIYFAPPGSGPPGSQPPLASVIFPDGQPVQLYYDIYAGSTNAPIDDKSEINKKKDPGCGMPVWNVSEPYISLWLNDEPLGYQPAVGARISFGLSYKQRELTNGYNPDFFSMGKKWNFPWFSCITTNVFQYNVVRFLGGGEHTFYTPNDYQTHTRLTGNTSTGFTLAYPDGSTNIYSFLIYDDVGRFSAAFLTQSINANGQATTFNYATYTPSASPVVRLTSVTDGDGRSSLVSYTTGNAYSANLISQITDPFGRTATFLYDSTGHLTNITDTAGNSSSIAYDQHDWATNLITPYGTNGFSICDTAAGKVAPDGRSILVTQPDGGHQLFLYTNNAPGVADSDTAPDTTPFANTFDVNELATRNSFHWGAQQYAALSTTTIPSFTANDFVKARMQHWLWQPGLNSPGQTISMSREPSPDSGGTTSGQKTWYDYAGKIGNKYEGTEIEPLFEAVTLQDGKPAFSYMLRNSYGYVTKDVSTYSVRSGVGLRTNIYVYGANDIDLWAVTNALGYLILSNMYNLYHQITTNYNALYETTAFTYDSLHRLDSIKWPTGLLTTNFFGADNFLAKRIDVGIATNSYTYANDLIFHHTNSLGLIVSNTWDNLNRLTSTVFPDGSYVSNRYTILDRSDIKDRLGNWTHFGYDSMRHLTSETNANGFITKYNYVCACGLLESIVDAANNTTTFSYDNQGNLTNTLSADGFSRTNTYDLVRRLVKTASSGGYNFTNLYNNQGLLISSANPAGLLITNIFDALDRLTNVVNANHVAISTVYDKLDRTVTNSYPDGGVERWGYTLNISGATSYTNQVGNVTFYGYDAANRKTNEVVADVMTNSFIYDGASDLLALKDGKGQTTKWTYDLFGLVSNKFDADNNLVLDYKYDADFRLTNRWMAAQGHLIHTNGETTYKYDHVGNLTNILYASNAPITFKYDALNRLTRMTDGLGTNVFAYDAVGQLLTDDGAWDADTISYTYNNRLRQTMSVQNGGGTAWAQSYGYDLARRLKNVASAAGSFGYDYNPLELFRVDQLNLPNGAYITNKFDGVARLASTILKNSGNTALDSYGYTYNQAGQRTLATRTAGDTVAYTYNNDGELLTAIGAESGSTPRWQEQFGYAYDGAGNLSWRTNNTLIQQFGVNDLNELTTVGSSGRLTVAGSTTSPATSVAVNTSNTMIYADVTFASTNHPWVNGNNTYTAVASDSHSRSSTQSITVNLAATVSYTYDLNGNLLSDGTRAFDYDDENQLIRVTVAGAWKTEFAYDGRLRRRISKDFVWNGSSWSQTGETRYVYDGNLVVEERDGNNLLQAAYTRGNDLSGSREGAGGIGGLLARTDRSQTVPWLSSGVPPFGTHSYYHADGAGNITALISSSQMIVAKYLYDPYGNMLSMYGLLADVNKYRFSSKEWNENSGLYYYLYRFFDPSLQRWLNHDPIGERGGLNLYGFVGNDPIDLCDPLGLWFILQHNADGTTTLVNPEHPDGITYNQWPPPASAEAVWNESRQDWDVHGGIETDDGMLFLGTGKIASELRGASKIARIPGKSGYVRQEEQQQMQKCEPRFPSLKDHAARHSDLKPADYYDRALKNIKEGLKVQVKHEGQNKTVYITRTGPDSFDFTSTSMNGKTIFTHIQEVDMQYLKNKGITLPNGF